MLPEVLPLRQASRELVRELGFLQGREPATQLSHSHCHALIEIESRESTPQGDLPGLLRLDKSTTSRIISELEARSWIKVKKSAADARMRVLTVTTKGRAKLAQIHDHANIRVGEALSVLSADDRATVVRGMQLYARALDRTRRRSLYSIRPISARDRADVARLIRTVMPEYGAEGPGYAIMDAEVDDMFGAYHSKRSGYWVVTKEVPTWRPDQVREVVVGGGGFAELSGGDGKTAELRKMYFLLEARGLGLGQELLDLCIEGATKAGYDRMYLETLSNMKQAQALYERNGFSKLAKPAGSTGHDRCDRYYVRPLGKRRKR